MRFPHSLGLLYSAFTYYTRLQGQLAASTRSWAWRPTASRVYVDLIHEQLIDLKDDGSLPARHEVLQLLPGLTMTCGRFDRPVRRPAAPAGVAAHPARDGPGAPRCRTSPRRSMLRMARHVHGRPAIENLCLAGGVALNCVGNGRILREGRSTTSVDPARGGRRRRRAGRGAVRLAPAARRAAPARRPATRSAARYLGPAFSRRRDRGVRCSAGAPYRRSTPTRAARPRRRAARRRQRGRLVPGPHGVRPPGARRPQHPRRRAQPGDAGH